MKSLAEFLFQHGYFPLLHESVKQDFISWYYEASKSEIVTEGLDAENSRMSELAQEARIEAEKFNQSHRIPQLVNMMEEMEARIQTVFYYVAAGAALLGGGLTAVGVLNVLDSLYSIIFGIVGGILFVGGSTAFILYELFKHQIKANSDLVTLFNKELSEKPGDIRSNDQDWHFITAQLFWNRSLLSPSTHVCLILLSLIRVLSKGMYGRISADLREQIKEFVGMNSREVIIEQLERVLEESRLPFWTRS